FETPPPTVVSSFPYNGQYQHLDAPMFVLFDQKIDAQAVLAKLVVTANGKPVTLRMLDAAEIEKAGKSKRPVDQQLAALVEGAKRNDQDGRWLAFRATADFPRTRRSASRFRPARRRRRARTRRRRCSSSRSAPTRRCA